MPLSSVVSMGKVCWRTGDFRRIENIKEMRWIFGVSSFWETDPDRVFVSPIAACVNFVPECYNAAVIYRQSGELNNFRRIPQMLKLFPNFF